MNTVYYGVFARLADWYHGWRDGRAQIPQRPRRTRRATTSAVAPGGITTQVTTAHREFLVRMAQDAFEHERLRHEARRVAAGNRLAGTRVQLRRAEEMVTRAADALAGVSAPLTEAEATERRAAETNRPESVVRARRQRDRLRRIHPFDKRHRVAVEKRDAADTAYAKAKSEALRDIAVAYARVRRIHEHVQRRIAAYRRRLARSHVDGPWVNSVLGVLDPHLPGWAMTGLELDENGDPIRNDEPISTDPEPAPPEVTNRFALLLDTTVFGSAPDADVRVDYYYAAPRHFALRRNGDTFTLVDYGHGHGPFIDGKELKRAWLKPGEYFDFGGFRYQISSDGQFVERFSFGKCDLVVYDVWAQTGDTVRISGMSVVQRENTVLAILGASGAGKTSLFYALMQELKIAETGDLYFRKHSLRTHGDQVRTMLGFVPQDDHLHRTLTVENLLRYSDQLRRPKAGRRDREEKILDVCRQLRVEKRLKQLVGTLSGGQRKRVSIALELLARPDLLMLDEPTSGLDAGMDREVMQLLRDYADQGRLVIVITHTTEHLDRARQLLVLASEGRAIYSGPPERTLSSLHKDTYADLMATLTDERKVAEVDEFVQQYADGSVVAEAKHEAAKLKAEETTSAVRRTRRLWGSTRRFQRQLPVLFRRQIALMIARGSSKNRKDRKLRHHIATPLVAGLPFVVAIGGALIAAAVAKSAGLGPGVSVPGTLSLLITLCMLSGQALTYGDIVSEFHIIKREHRTGAVTAAVVVAKWMVFAVAASIQAALITVIFVGFKPGPVHANVFSPATELFVDLAAMTIAAMTLGMLISALASTIEQAVNWNTFIAIGQIALNGVAADLSGGGPVNIAASILPTRWGLAAAASSIDLPTTSPTAPRDALWQHTTSQWLTDLTWLAGMTAVFFVITIAWLSRKLNKPG